MKVTYLGTTVLLFDDGKDQILFDAHMTRPSLVQYLTGQGRTDQKLVIPLHWDNFFTPLDQPLKPMPRIVEKTEEVFFELMKYCEKKGVDCLVQLPRTQVTI